MGFSLVKYFNKRKAIAEAYGRVFASEDGKTVLRDLMSKFGVTRETGSDPVVAASFRSVIFYVLKKIGADEQTVLNEIHKRIEERVLDDDERKDQEAMSDTPVTPAQVGFFN